MNRNTTKERVVRFYRCEKCRKQFKKECPASVAYCETMTKCPSSNCNGNLKNINK